MTEPAPVPRRVALVRLSAVGDIVHTWPLAVALRAALPSSHLTWVVEEPLRPLVEGHPAVDQVVAVNTRRWRRAPLSPATRAEIRAVRRRLRGLECDLAVDAQGLVKSAVVTRWTAARRRVGLRRPWRRELLAGLAYHLTIPGPAGSPHVVATNLELVRAAGAVPPDPTPCPDGGWLAQRALAPPAADPRRPRYAVLLVGAGRQVKVLPTATLVAVATGLEEHGLEVVAAWGPGEREAAERLAAASAGRVLVAPPTDLLQLAALLAQAALVVGPDTGPLHLAASLAVPTVGVFLTTSPARNGPLGARVATVAAVTDQGGRRGSAHARPARDLDAGEILTAAATVLAAG